MQVRPARSRCKTKKKNMKTACLCVILVLAAACVASAEDAQRKVLAEEVREVVEVLERMENEVQRGLVGKTLERIREYQANAKDSLSVHELLSRSCFDEPKNPLCWRGINGALPRIEDQCEMLHMDQLSLSYDSAKFSPPTLFALMLVDVFLRVTSGVIACIAASAYDAVYALGLFISALPPLNIALAMFSHFVPRLAWLVDWVFVVPKGDFVTPQHLECLAWRIPSLCAFALLVYLLRANRQEQREAIEAVVEKVATVVTFPLLQGLELTIIAWNMFTAILHILVQTVFVFPWAMLYKMLHLITSRTAQEEPAAQSGEEEEKKKDE